VHPPAERTPTIPPPRTADGFPNASHDTVSLLLGSACLCAATPVLAQDAPRFPVSAVPARGAGVQAFVPAGWKAASEAAGDLNGDGRPDRVVHVVPRGTDYDPDGVTAAPEATTAPAAATARRSGVKRFRARRSTSTT
jgi:hypothetical protein